jgi:hypothetical protein
VERARERFSLWDAAILKGDGMENSPYRGCPKETLRGCLSCQAGRKFRNAKRKSRSTARLGIIGLLGLLLS